MIAAPPRAAVLAALALSSLASGAWSAVSATSAAGDPPLAEEPSLIRAASASATETGDAASAPRPAKRPFWRSLLRDHWEHVATVYGAVLADKWVDDHRGPRADPLFWNDPPHFDVSIRDRYRRGPGDTDSHGFVESHVTPVTRGIALGIIFASNGKRWRDDVDDVVGLWEAQRFNKAITGLVKNVVGRERPRLALAEDDGLTSAEAHRLAQSDSNHQSFYSYHASSAFTTLSYADLVLSRRLANHDAARRWSRAGLYALGGYIAWARVLQDGHWFSDIVVGSMAGIYTGRSFYAFNHHDGADRWLSWDPRPGSRITLSPPAPLPGGGLVLGTRIAF